MCDVVCKISTMGSRYIHISNCAFTLLPNYLWHNLSLETKVGKLRSIVYRLRPLIGTLPLAGKDENWRHLYVPGVRLGWENEYEMLVAALELR